MNVSGQRAPTGVVIEHASCEICGADQPTPVAARPDLFLGGTMVYTMCRCGRCGAVYQEPRPTAATIHLLYPADSYPEYTPGLHTQSLPQRILRRYGLGKRARRVERHVRGGRLLDVGCSTGDFIEEVAQRAGWTAVGIDIGVAAVRYAHLQIGLDTAAARLNDAPFAAASFDAITMWNVFEHVYDPRAVIREAARLLRPGGILLITHPNLGSLDRQLFGNLWIGYELPRHIYLLPARLLGDMMAEAGLHEVERACFYSSHAATATSLTFVLRRVFGTGRLSRMLSAALYSPPARLLAGPYFWILDRLRLGSNITAIFRKDPHGEPAKR